MERQEKTVHVNGIDFYCEVIGSGPSIVLVPDGSNDCEPFRRVAELLSDEFTVACFDMRGGTRSMDHDPKPVTAKMLADDVAGIIDSLGLGRASVYGCSSGGQTVLSLGKYHAKKIRNIMAHEAALQHDAPVENAGYEFFKRQDSYREVVTKVSMGTIWGYADYDKYLTLSEACRARIKENGTFWRKYYVGNVDTAQYTKEDFAAMSPTAFSVGAFTPAWLVYANIATAERGGCPVEWFNCAHHPEVTMPEELAAYIKQTVKQYI